MRAIGSMVALAMLTFAALTFSASAISWDDQECLRQCVVPKCIERSGAAVSYCIDECRIVCAASGSPKTVGDVPPLILPAPLEPALPNPPLREPLRIIDTRSAPLFHPGEEAPGYGLYTYVLLRGRRDRDSHFVKYIGETAPAATEIAPPLRAQIDLMLIPANPCPATSGKSVSDCAANLIDNVMSDLKTFYNYDEFEHYPRGALHPSAAATCQILSRAVRSGPISLHLRSARLQDESHPATVPVLRFHGAGRSGLSGLHRRLRGRAQERGFYR